MNDLTSPQIDVPVSPELKTQRWSVRNWLSWPAISSSALLLVALPTLVAAIYYGLIASDIYISETRYAIRSTDRAPSSDLLSAVLAPAGISSSNEDSKIVRDYILSRDMLNELDSRLDLRAHYSSPNRDWVRRLAPMASEEDFLEYYRDMVVVHTDSNSHITVLRVRAFQPETAQLIATTVTELSERLINRWSERITEDTLRFARKELDTAETHVRNSSAALTNFRNESGSVDPGEETAALLGIITNLETKLSAAKADLIATESFMQSESSQVKQLKGQIAALERQIINERTRLAGKSGADLARLISGYQPLILDQQLAEQRYASALTSLEVARAEAQRQQRYLIPFVTPELPDEPLEPKRLLNIFTIFMGSLLLFGIGNLIWAAVNEHVGR